ncbi:MAG: isomerizing glutamine--fructose-6-phosphate transaminase, partial [Verrucomicrobia bacterium]|nr:isomerizing glutamine--fructose-6-phosphate transaminase [Verrucomicrobiota bacterium]
MCGIIGYIGKQQATPILIEGLRRLEYRGYDSAGVAVLQNRELATRKKKGKIDEGLAKLVQANPIYGQVGMGHTRWATHGPPTDENSHPHLDQSGKIAVVHNGVIENFDSLKERFIKEGDTFKSATDTEVLAHLIGHHYDQLVASGMGNWTGEGTHPLAQAVMNALREVIGTYGIGVICTDHPGVMVGARRGSPLIVGVGEGEHFLASDASAIVSHTRTVIYLKDYDVVTLFPDKFKMDSLGSEVASFQLSKIEFDADAAERGTFAHYMLKEIFEQPKTVKNAIRGRLDAEDGTAKFGGLNMTTAELRAIDQIVITACGTSWHAALVGEYLIEEFAHIPVEVEYAS